MNLTIGGHLIAAKQPVFTKLPSSFQQKNEAKVQRDTIFISNEARQQFGQNTSSLIENLMKQRDKVQEMKSNLTERTLENGDDLSTVKEQLAQFDEQIAEIEQQLLAIEEQKRQKEQREKEEKIAATQPKQNSEDVQMTSLMQSAQSLQRAEGLERVKGILKRDHTRLNIEARNDASRGVFLESKQEKIQDLEKRMRSLERAKDTQIGEAAKASEKAENAHLEEDEE